MIHMRLSTLVSGLQSSNSNSAVDYAIACANLFVACMRYVGNMRMPMTIDGIL
jgi:hypothetical protein